MLLPQHHIQQMCQQCGRLPAYVTAFCPSCGTRLALPWPCQSSGPTTPAFSLPVAPPSQSPSVLPLIVETSLNMVGIYGVGWLILGKITGGLTWLLGSLILWSVVVLLSIFTMGLGLVCLCPFALAAMIGNLLLLQKAIKPDTLEKDMRERNILVPPTFTPCLDLSFPVR